MEAGRPIIFIEKVVYVKEVIMPKVSIIIPLYNKEQYISKLLQQIMLQTYGDYECILVDDGSTDMSGDICDEFVKKDERFRVIHIHNSGVSTARNVGLNSAVGKYITFVDADDMINPIYIENLYNAIVQNDTDIVISGLLKVWEDYDKKEILIPPYHGKQKLKNILPYFATVQNDSGIYGTCVAKMFSKDLLGEIRFDSSLRLAEDFDFYLKIYSKVSTVYFDDRAYYYYLQEAENSSIELEDSKIDYLSQLKIQLRFKQFLISFDQYVGDNKEIVEKKINNYFFYILHYSSNDKFDEYFETIQKIYKSEAIQLAGNGIRQRVLLWLVKRNKKREAKFLVGTYHYIRKNVRKW